MLIRLLRFLAIAAGLILSARIASAQITGQVESIGFGGYYRGGCWTPMRIQLRNAAPQARQVEIRVRQLDLDHDTVNYTRTITVNGSAAGNQTFWMEFIPQTVDGGLSSAADGGTLDDLRRKLQVGLYTPDGKALASLSLTALPTDVNRLSADQGTRLVLLVQSPGGRPQWQGFLGASGLLEQVAMTPIQAEDLPPNVIGYNGVDAVVWLNAPPPDPRLPSQRDRFEALRQYVRQGGHLVICQSSRWRDVERAFGSFMPVQVATVKPNADLSGLLGLAKTSVGKVQRPAIDAAAAVAKPDAVVDAWMNWPAATTQPAATHPATTSAPATRAVARTPLIARRAEGMGSVSWVARDLGDRTLVRALPNGWAGVWDRVLGWHDEVIPAAAPKSQRAKFMHAGRVNLGGTMLQGIDLPARTGGYVAIAILFFILYWLAAGPLSYLVLSARRRVGLSWWVFALAALLATGLTMLIVQWVVRGAPRGRHVTLVRMTPGEPAVITSRIGLYIPHDGEQTIRLGGTTPGRVSDLIPLPLPDDPQAAGGGGFITPMAYRVPVPRAGDETVELAVPYRSTLKKLQARWIGSSPSLRGIEGRVRLDRAFPWLSGTLTNRIGRDLTDVYLAFKSPAGQDRMIYLPRWEKDASVDLHGLLTARDDRPVFVARVASAVAAPPGVNRRLNDALFYPSDPTRGWAGYWYGQFSGGFGLTTFTARDPTQAMPMLSLFSLLPPMPTPSDSRQVAVDLLRRGARFMDASAAVTAGKLLILGRDADADGPLPFPVAVEGLFGDTPVEAQGTTYYQILLPLDRSAASVMQ